MVRIRSEFDGDWTRAIAAAEIFFLKTFRNLTA